MRALPIEGLNTRVPGNYTISVLAPRETVTACRVDSRNGSATLPGNATIAMRQ
jgi:hypothetical protein